MTSEEHDDLVDRITDTERRLGDAERKLLKLTSERKAAREDVEVLQLELRRLTRELADPKPMPLFDEPPTAPAGQPESTVGHGLGCGAISDPAPEAEGISSISGLADHDAWRSIPVAEIPGLSSEAVEALKADGVATAGDWIAKQMDGGEMPVYDNLDWEVRNPAERALNAAVEARLPHCRICRAWDEDYYELKPGERGDMWVEGEEPLLCDQCVSLRDGPPDVEAIAAEAPNPDQNWTLPDCLRKAPLKDPTKQLGRLKAGFDEEAGRESVSATRYRSLVASWPEPPPDIHRVSDDSDDDLRTRYVSRVQVELEHVAKARGRMAAIQAEIDRVRDVVEGAAAAKAAKKSASRKKPQPAMTAAAAASEE
jgi:hypothetical protein